MFNKNTSDAPPAGEPSMNMAGKRRISFGNVKTFESFKSPAYRFLFLGLVGQWSSMNMQMATNSLLVYRITGSAALLGLLALASSIPMVLLSPFGGAIADRLPKKTLIQASQIALAVLTLIIIISLTTGYLGPAHPESWWVLVVSSVLQGTIFALAMPARLAIIPSLVGKDQVMNATSLNHLGFNVCRLVAPAIAGILIDAVGFTAVFYIMFGLYAMSIFFTFLLPFAGTVPARHNALVDIRDGLKYVRQNTILFSVLVFSGLAILLSSPFQFLLPVFTDSIFKVGATGLGLLMSVSGVGALIASLVLASVSGKKRGFVLLSSTLVLCFSLIGFAFSGSWPVAMGLMVFIGAGQTIHAAVSTALFQTYSDEQYLGRVMSLTMMTGGLGNFGTFFAGVLAESVGAPWAIGSFAMVLALLVILALLFVPRIHKLE